MRREKSQWTLDFIWAQCHIALSPWAHLPKSIFMVDWTLFSLLKASNTYYLAVEECLLFIVQNPFSFFNLFEPLNRGTSFIPPTHQPIFIPIQMLHMWEGLSKTENQGAICSGGDYLRVEGGQEGREAQRNRENAFSFCSCPWRFLPKKSCFCSPASPNKPGCVAPTNQQFKASIWMKLLLVFQPQGYCPENKCHPQHLIWYLCIKIRGMSSLYTPLLLRMWKEFHLQ